jgi:hypothetical protein
MGIGSPHKTKGQIWLHRGPQHRVAGTARWKKHFTFFPHLIVGTLLCHLVGYSLREDVDGSVAKTSVKQQIAKVMGLNWPGVNVNSILLPKNCPFVF